MVQEWSQITLESLQKLWQGFLTFIPKLIGAIVIFVIGWFISIWIGKLIAAILKKIKLDRLFQKTDWQEALEKAEFKISVSDFIGELVKWILVIVFLLAAVDILQIPQFAGFLKEILAWLPNLVVAVAIFVVAVVVAEFAEKLARALVGKLRMGYSKVIGSIVKWAVWIFAILAILIQLGIAKDLIQILVTGFVALIVISFGIAFGLGGKDVAREMLENFRNRLRE